MATQENRLTLLRLEDVLAYFDQPVSTFLTIEQAVCYIASSLLKADCYGTGLIEDLRQVPGSYAMSDTICHAALAFTVKEGLATSTEKKASRRGRPRRMFKLKPSQREKAKELAAFWDGMIAGAAKK
jgi:DNA-binding PadR family transcriptional regulator